VSGFRDRGGWWVLGQLVLFAGLAVALLTGPVLEFGGDVLVRAAGAVVFLAGAALGVAALGHLGRQLTPYPRPVPGGELVEGGLYGRTRHPIYGGVILIAVGAAVYDLNPVALAVAALFLPYFWAKSGHEERMLAEHYPAYEHYRRRVRRRLIPWVL
jgi:protein-S-isoprenylcysteine O-methyltransferase Ste14